MFTDTDQTIEINGFTATATIVPDDYNEAPWNNDDGHGPVSDWTRRDKEPGELVLCEERGSKRYYNYAEACRIALRAGWGTLPAPLKTEQTDNGWRASSGNFTATAPDLNEAIRSVYAAHRATFPSRRAYAAAAARADYERLRAWCNGDWHYVGVQVTVSRAGIELANASLWSIESDAGDYLIETANELLQEALDEAADTIKRLTASQ